MYCTVPYRIYIKDSKTFPDIVEVRRLKYIIKRYFTCLHNVRYGAVLSLVPCKDDPSKKIVHFLTGIYGRLEKLAKRTQFTLTYHPLHVCTYVYSLTTYPFCVNSFLNLFLFGCCFSIYQSVYCISKLFDDC